MKKILAACLIATAALGETKVRNSITQGAPINVIDKGALNDGTNATTTTTGIQTAIAAAQALPNGGTVFFPCGTYLSNQIVISGSKVALLGQSRYCVTIKQNSASITGLINFTSGPLSNISIRGLKLDANGKTPTMNAYDSLLAPVNPGINLGVFNVGTDVTGLIVDDNEITGFDYGIHVPWDGVGALSKLHASSITNNVLTGLSPSGGVCSDPGPGCPSATERDHCTTEGGCLAYSVTTMRDHKGIRLNADGTLVEKNILSGWTNGIETNNASKKNRIVWNVITTPMGSNNVGIPCFSCDHTTVAYNTVDESAFSNDFADGCIVVGATSSPLSSFAKIEHNTCIRGHIKVAYAADTTIIANTVENPQSTGCGENICIGTNAANQRIKVADNKVTGGSGHGVGYRAGGAVNISNNDFDDGYDVGVAIWGTGLSPGTVIAANRIRNSKNQCIYVDNSGNGTITGNSCYRDVGSWNATPGIRVGSTTSYYVVTGNLVNRWTNGFQIDVGTNTGNVVGLNTVLNATTWGIFADNTSVGGMLAWNNVIGGTANTWNASNSPMTAQFPIQLGPLTFANLGTPANLTVVGCTDCTIANPCASGGTGAMAKRLNGVWVCN